MESLNNQCSSSNKDNNYSQLCNYQLLNKIGEGQFGVVLLSRFRPTGELLAAKVMDKNKMQRIGEKQIEHIQNERKILESLPNHVYINKLFAFIETEDKYYLINEYISGGDLALKLSQLPGYRLATHVAKLCVAEVLTAIEFLHQNNIIYRDLKPGNILIDKSGHIKLTDFGCAKWLQNHERTKTMCGTVDYIPPEVIIGEGFSKASDWWSFGVLLFEMLAGSTPWAHCVLDKQHEANNPNNETTNDVNMDMNVYQCYKRILYGRIQYPEVLLPTAKDLLEKLLVREDARIMVDEIKQHEWFSDVNWKNINNPPAKGPFSSRNSSTQQNFNVASILFQDF